MSCWSGTLWAFLDVARPYTLDGVADHIGQDVLILTGTADHLIPADQVGRLQRALIDARTVTRRIHDRASGGHRHFQLGAPSLWQADFFDWLHAAFE